LVADSGAGVLRAVLARRARSDAREGCGLIAVPRDAGRRIEVADSGPGVERGVAPREDGGPGPMTRDGDASGGGIC
jgi:hypothetical protein